MARGLSMKVGAIWRKKDRNDKPYLSIALDGPLVITDPRRFGFVAFANDKPDRTDNDPTYLLYVTEQTAPEDRSDFDDDERQSRGGQQERRETQPAGRRGDPRRDDDDPFANE